MLSTVLRLQLVSPCILLLCFYSGAAFAQSNHDRTQVGSNISIGAHEEASDATCFGCSIRVRGHVAGDVTAFGGSIVVEEDGQVDGDATAFGGGIRVENEAKVRGDITVFGGRIQRDPRAAIGGDVTTMGGPGWVLLIFVAPFVLLGLFIALIVWAVRRILRPRVPATA